jgi:hypothetical protein
VSADTEVAAKPVTEPPVRQSTLLDSPVRQALAPAESNRKAYLRDYMREYMRRRRAAQATLGRPPKGNPLSNAERQRRYRARHKATA